MLNATVLLQSNNLFMKQNGFSVGNIAMHNI